MNTIIPLQQVMSLTISPRPQTPWGLANMLAQVGANRVGPICANSFATYIIESDKKWGLRGRLTNPS